MTGLARWAVGVAVGVAAVATTARPLEFDDIAREGELRLLAKRSDPEG